jgi:hypothetical protein
MIRMVGNIVTGSDEATEKIIRSRMIEHLYDVFYYFSNKKLPRVRKEICWVLSNISAGTEAQTSYIINGNFLGLLVDGLSKYELYVRKEAIYGISNILYFCISHPEDLQRVIDHGVVRSLGNFLSGVTSNPDFQILVLDALKYGLEAGRRIGSKTGCNPMVSAMIDTKLVDDVEELQDVKNPKVVEKAYKIIMDYFDGEDE